MTKSEDEMMDCYQFGRVDRVAPSREELKEQIARLVYDTWEPQPGFVPWVERGNSRMQDKARDTASAILSLPAIRDRVAPSPEGIEELARRADRMAEHYETWSCAPVLAEAASALRSQVQEIATLKARAEKATGSDEALASVIENKSWYYLAQGYAYSYDPNRAALRLRSQAQEIAQLTDGRATMGELWARERDARAAREQEIATLKARVEALTTAGQAVVDRWDTPLWKDVEPTGHVIARLRAALSTEDPKQKDPV